MSWSESGKPDPDLEGAELLFHQKGGSASFGAKMALSLNGVDLGWMNPITGATCRAKCSNILDDIPNNEGLNTVTATGSQKNGKEVWWFEYRKKH